MLDETIDLDRTFQALADKSRRTMVERLTLGPASVSELAEPLAMSLAAVVQHVQVLEACGVVKTEKVGRTRMCRIERAAMTAAEAVDRRPTPGLGSPAGPTGRRPERGSQYRGETMTESTVAHDTFVIERTYDIPVARVFRAWADPLLKARWFAGSADALGAGYELDFRVGGREINRGGPPGGPRLHVRVAVPRHRSRTADRLHVRDVRR